jgi:DASS family divalent anion:Na+ symporter
MISVAKKQSVLKFSLAFFIGLLIWMLPEPAGLSVTAWRVFALFFSTIICIILNPFPMGAITVVALTIGVITRTISWSDISAGFGNDIVWLIVFVFFVSKAFVSTGLGSRIAYGILRLFGRNSLGLGYGLVATNLIVSPCIPSVTARAGGVIFPMIKSLAEVFSGKSNDPRMGAFLTLCAYQSMAITSAMFLTAMAGNPMIAMLAQENTVAISWADWAIAAIVPGLASLLILPYFIYRFWPPLIRQTPHVKEMARERLRAMGPMSFQEKIMIATMILLIVLWIFGHFWGLKETVAAMAGVSILLLTGILHWKDILEEQSAWDTLIWFATLVILASQLNKSGFSIWFSQSIVGYVEGFHWGWGFSILILIYFYTHYFFASAVAHIGAMYAPFLLVAVLIGTPPQMAALVLAFISNLNVGLTHYGSGSAPVLFSGGFVSVREWWKVGFIFSIILLMVWFVIGGLWWKLLGLW